MPDGTARPIAPRVARFRRGLTLRSNSVLITMFGDALAPRQAPVWLGSLIALATLFGLSSRQVRTSAFRLVANDWLTATRVGRRSYYALSPAGLLRSGHADRRIYEFSAHDWDGHWTLVMMDSHMPASAKLKLRRELLWEGYGQITPLVFAHPHSEPLTLAEILRGQASQDQVAVLRGQNLPGFSRAAWRKIMYSTYKLAEVESAWKLFIQRFSPLVNETSQLGPAEAFFVRILLIHEYRRVQLRDPNLPKALLTVDWPGEQARKLCKSLYIATMPRSNDFLASTLQTLQDVRSSD